ncbi:MAG: response regulator [Nitrospirae bacterium]|nr:response regulator [Nitrospirota bacterium]
MSILSDPPTTTGDILIIDDDPSGLKLMFDVLSEAGYQVRPAIDGELALRSVQARQPDLILLDIRMSGMDGFEVCRRLKEDMAMRDIPVIFLSSLADTFDKVKGFELGAVDYITKPPQAKELLARVVTHLALSEAKARLKAQNLQLQNEIAERKRAEEELRYQKEHLEEIVAQRTAELKKTTEEVFDLYNNAPCGYHSLDKDGVFIKINDTELNWLGYTKEEVVGRLNFSYILTTEGLKTFEYNFPLLKQRGWVRDLEYEMIRKDGSTLLVLLNSTAVKDNNGCFIMSRSTLYDITERKFEETERRRMQEQMLIQQSKMAAMGEMISLIAHQWKQPLNAISAIIMDMDDAYSCGELDNKYMERSKQIILQQIQFMTKTVDDFRDFMLPSKEKIPFCIKKAIEELISMFSPLFRKSDIALSLTCIGEEFVTLGYKNEFKQVILNLIDNSKDAICSSRQKEMSDAETEGKIEIEIFKDSGKTIVIVRDNGGGIPDDIIDKIFDAYFTTKSLDEGTGIGLYMCKTIIENNMDWKLTVKSTYVGAEFRIEI